MADQKRADTSEPKAVAKPGRSQHHSQGKRVETEARLAVSDRRTGERRSGEERRRAGWENLFDPHPVTGQMLSGRRVQGSDPRKDDSDRRVGPKDRRDGLLDRRGFWKPTMYKPSLPRPYDSQASYPTLAQPAASSATPVVAAESEEAKPASDSPANAAFQRLPVQPGESTMGGKLQGDIVSIKRDPEPLPRYTASGWVAWARRERDRQQKDVVGKWMDEVFKDHPRMKENNLTPSDKSGFGAMVATILSEVPLRANEAIGR